METKEELCTFISGEIRAYVASSDPSERRNKIGILEKKTGVSNSTLRRIADNEQTTVTESTAYSLTSFFLGTRKAIEIMRPLYPKFYNNTGKFRDSSINNTSDINWDAVSTWIMDMATRPTGVSKDEIIDAWGRKLGLEIAELMAQTEVLKYKTEKFYAEENATDSNVRSVFQRIKSTVDLIDPDGVDRGVFYFRKTRALSEELYEEARTAHREYFTALGEIEDRSKSIPKEKKTRLMRACLIGDFIQLGETNV